MNDIEAKYLRKSLVQVSDVDVKLRDMAPNGGFQKVTVSGKSFDARMRILKVFDDRSPGIDPNEEMCRLALDPGYECVLPVSSSYEKAGWFSKVTHLDKAYTEPYAREYLRRFGKPIPHDLDLSDQIPDGGVCHTGLMLNAYLEHGVFCAVSVRHNHDYWGRSADVRAVTYGIERAKNTFGETVVQSEYIERGNGLYTRNPGYACGKWEYRPALSCRWAWDGLVNHFLLNEASEEQVRIHVADSEYCAAMRLQPTLYSPHVSGGPHVDGDYMTREQFIAAGGK